MSSSLTSYYVKIADADIPFRFANSGPFLWGKQLRLEDFTQLKSMCEESSASEAPCLFGALAPVRSNNWENFSYDCLLPATMNYAFNIEDCSLKIIGMIGAIFFDLATSPIRLLTCLPSIWINSRQQEHPIYKLFTEDYNVDKAIFASGRIRVALLERQVDCVTYKISPTPRLSNIKDQWKTYCIDLIKMPDGIKESPKVMNESTNNLLSFNL
jgi:hypothetical protein